MNQHTGRTDQNRVRLENVDHLVDLTTCRGLRAGDVSWHPRGDLPWDKTVSTSSGSASRPIPAQNRPSSERPPLRRGVA